MDERASPALIEPTHAALGAHDVGRLAADFGLHVIRWSRLDGGVENTTFVLSSDEGDLVLTVLEKRDLATAEAYARFLHSVREHGIAAPRIVRLRAGGSVAILGGKPAILTEFVHGSSAATLRDEHVYAVGRTLAELHSSGLDCPLEPSVRLVRRDPGRDAPPPDTEFERWLTTWYERVGEPLASPALLVPTHGDPFPGNVILRDTGEIVLIDWEDAAADSPLVDLGMAIVGLCGGDEFVPELAESLLAGYRSGDRLGVDLGDLFSVTIYVGLVVAHNRRAREARGLSDPSASSAATRHFVDSFAAAWDPRVSGAELRDR